MELLYNPDSMLEEEIKKTFVARHHVIKELVSLIEHQPDGAGVQHVVIIAPRGMGKTTVLLMLQFAVRDGALSKLWQTIKFAEESYSVYDLADFWIEALERLATEMGDLELLARAEKLKTQYAESDDLQEAALALIKDWRQKNQKRLIMLVDNFDMILEQINDERDNARLRDVLMNDGTMMLIGGATTFFREARAYDQPLYNFFKIINLENLRFEQMQELLRRRAEIDRIPNFEEKLKANEGRLRVLEYFTGGNPRLVLMLYRVVTQSDISEVRRGLEKLLDEVTPYYKSKIESLPAQQRKILDHIARTTSRTREGVTPSEIAESTRLKANQVSSQLKRLAELGYVRAANLRERNSYYTLSEPLYAIWHQMRFGRDARQRMQWLVDFLKVWYDATEKDTESTRLAAIFREYLSAGRIKEARNALDHRRYLAEAMDDSSARIGTLESVICSYLELKDFDILKKEVLTPDILQNLSEGTLNSLYQAGCINKEDIEHYKASTPSSLESQKDAEVLAAVNLALKTLEEGRASEALEHIKHALRLAPNEYNAWIVQAFILIRLGKYLEAVTTYDHALEIKPDDSGVWHNRGYALSKLSRYEEAIASFDKALGIKPDDENVWGNRGNALTGLNRYEEAIASYDRVLEIKPDDKRAWYNRANSLIKLGRYEEGVTSYDRVLEIELDDNEAWVNRGYALAMLNRHEEAIASYDRVLEIKPDDKRAWYNRGNALAKLDKYEEAVLSYDRALELKPDDDESWNNRGNSLAILGRYEDAVASYDRALEVKPNKAMTWLNRGNALSELDRYEEAIASYDHAIDSDSGVAAFAHLMKLRIRISIGNVEAARDDWYEALKSAKQLDREEWFALLSTVLLAIAEKQGHHKFIRQLIAESDELEARLFPLARALDYLLTGDESLIEKLSPEVQNLVEEIVVKLRKAAGNDGPPKTKARTRKSKSGSRRRTTKQLR